MRQRPIFNIQRSIVLIGMSLLLAGCTSTSVQQTTQTQQEKAVNTTLSGMVTKSGGKFYINSAGAATKEIDSYTVKLDDYVGKKVSVTGQYSGITLFVDTISLVQ